MSEGNEWKSVVKNKKEEKILFLLSITTARHTSRGVSEILRRDERDNRKIKFWIWRKREWERKKEKKRKEGVGKEIKNFVGLNYTLSKERRITSDLHHIEFTSHR